MKKVHRMLNFYTYKRLLCQLLYHCDNISAEGAAELCHPFGLYTPAGLYPRFSALHGRMLYPQLRCFASP